MSAPRSALVPAPGPLPPRRPPPRAGFSVIELMVALVVLGLGILGLANVFPLGLQSQIKDRLRSSAVDLAQQKMEQLRLETWSGTSLTDGIHPTTSGETMALPDEGNFTRHWFVETQGGSFSDMKRVTVRVQWSYLRTDSVEMVSYFRR